MDDSQNSMQKKIRDNSRQKIPYLLIVGDREVEQGSASMRRRGEKQQEMDLGESAAARARSTSPVVPRRHETRERGIIMFVVSPRPSGARADSSSVVDERPRKLVFERRVRSSD